MPTGIEWTEETWNPKGDPFKPGTFHTDKLDLPLRWKKPRKIFVSSMGDLFHEDVPFYFIDRVHSRMLFANSELDRKHTYIILTKRPQRALEYYSSSIPNDFSKHWLRSISRNRLIENRPYIWLGVTAENQERADERIPILLEIPAAVRFVSVEPMLGPVDISRYLSCELCGGKGKMSSMDAYGCEPEQDEIIDCPACIKFNQKFLDWTILGGESGPGARPMSPEWARSVRDQCSEAGVPFFMKQMSKKAPIPSDLLIREYPKC